jgi:hypothetical protein
MALDIEHMGGGRTLPSMLRKGIFSCCYEHCIMSVRQGEVVENCRTIDE